MIHEHKLHTSYAYRTPRDDAGIGFRIMHIYPNAPKQVHTPHMSRKRASSMLQAYMHALKYVDAYVIYKHIASA